MKIILLSALLLSGIASAQNNQIQLPKIPISKVAGTYMSTDGIRGLIISEVYADNRWDGKLSFFPPVGDWSKTVRCRISGYDLIVEIPGEKPFICKMFRIESPSTITGNISPWSGTFNR